MRKALSISLMPAMVAVVLVSIAAGPSTGQIIIPLPTWSPAFNNYNKNASVYQTMGVSKARIVTDFATSSSCESSTLVPGTNSPCRSVTAHGCLQQWLVLFGKSTDVFRYVLDAHIKRGEIVWQQDPWNPWWWHQAYSDSVAEQWTSAYVRVGQITLLNRATEADQSLGDSRYFRVLDGHATVYCGPYPVTFRTHVGAGVGYSVAATTNSWYPEAKLRGHAGGWSTASFSGGVGYPGAQVKLKATMNLGCQTAGLDFSAAPSWGGGFLDYTFDPMRLYLDIIAQFLFFSQKFQIFDWSLGRIAGRRYLG
jgi:hypothetical protein